MTNLLAENRNRNELKYVTDVDKAVLVDITNVAEWVQLLPHDDFTDDEFIENLPWECCWFEWKEPSLQRIRGKINVNKGGDVYGCLAKNQGGVNYFSVYSKEFLNHEDEFHLGVVFRNKKGELQCIVSPTLAYKLKSRGIKDDVILSYVITKVYNVLYALTFLHCRNVTYYDVNHPEKLRKANEKRGKVPQETYKVLDIGGLQKQSKAEKKEGESELKRALHICRGHFKTYTDENPLFGKITGKFWTPMHTRGDESHGKIHKDYRI